MKQANFSLPLPIETWTSLTGKSVLVRIDGNVPLQDGKITNDFRLRALIPTLNFLRQGGAHITLATHLGRPQGYDSTLSTAPLQRWFIEHGYAVTVLENLRFNAGEKKQDKHFAQQLADDFDYYVNDAWGTAHRHDTSTTLVPQLFDAEHKSLGFLMRNELQSLAMLKNTTHAPYLIFLGGGKPETKLPYLQDLIRNAHPTTIVVLPALVFTFLKAQNKPVGRSLVDDALLALAQEIMTLAQQEKVELLFPVDYYTSPDFATCEPFNLHAADSMPQDEIGITVGPLSVQLFKERITQAKTIFYNGAMGNPKIPKTLAPMHELLQAIADAQAYTALGGGDSVAEAECLGLIEKLSWCSTGGGSTLAYISGADLPALESI